MPSLFPKRNDKRARSHTQPPEERKPDMTVEAELSSLSAGAQRRNVDRAVSEAETAVSAATFADIRAMHVVRKGRCPKCGARIDELLFTSICPMCGWYRQTHARNGRCVFHLDNGTTVECDRFYRVENDQVLCVKDDHVICQVSRRTCLQISYEWEESQLIDARSEYEKRKAGVCSWCEATLADLADDAAPCDDYVAFGAFQEHYHFCSRKCLASFRKQYPVRIHRNCYETDCNLCDQCAKRYDTQNFVRLKPEELTG